MSFDDPTRNRLNRFVSAARGLLTDEFTNQCQQDYGLNPKTGEVIDLDRLANLDDTRRQTAVILRETLQHYLACAPKQDKATVKATIERIIREQAFTVLNRLCAIRMAEARGLVIESIGKGVKSKGFQLYQQLASSGLGETGSAYRQYLFSLFDEFAVDLAVLFDRFSPVGRLFPGESALQALLDQINHAEIDPLWCQDETIGWIYQYFNSQEERKSMRDASSAPRDSRELAVRNQFFTPRYVVEFLTDNTLGRIWYEMTQGKTGLKESCRYLVRRPDEVFLSQFTSVGHQHSRPDVVEMAQQLIQGDEATFPEFSAADDTGIERMISLAHTVYAYTTVGYDTWHDDKQEMVTGNYDKLTTQQILEHLFMTNRAARHGGDGSVYRESWFVAGCNEVRRRALHAKQSDLSQEELLKQPVFIPFRQIKDPRDLKMLDPACGSMHFGLYAFDLFEKIYDEAWEFAAKDGDLSFTAEDQLPSLQQAYGTKKEYLLHVPKLIIERNIHGIDIDPRAVQIAGLSLWLRAQKSWNSSKIKAQDRPTIQKSNIVCAEPMPGEADMLEEFIEKHLSSDSEKQVIASIVRKVFESMTLAGEAGSLLKVEEEISETIAAAKKRWINGPVAVQLPLFSMDEPQKDKRERPLLLGAIEDSRFWDEIEGRIYSALEAYGEQAESGGYQRRLFANDAAQGFAFIDLCRKRYDVVVMNPPFGEVGNAVFDNIDKNYPFWNTNLLCAFIERGWELTWVR